MKHTKRTITLLLTALMLTSCLLPLAGCTSTTPAPESPFNDTLPPEEDKGSDQVNDKGSDNDKSDDKGNDKNDDKNDDKSDDKSDNEDKDNDRKPNPSYTTTRTGWQADIPRGEKRLYGKGDRQYVLRSGDMVFGYTNYSGCDGYYSFDEPDNAHILCFDPLCPHMPQQDSCTAIVNSYFYFKEDDPNHHWPIHTDWGMYLDEYENADSPVIYYYYRRSAVYFINWEETGTREAFSCIERFDISQGKRYTVVDNIAQDILQACNYGDYVYYVLDMGEDEGQALYRVHKSGAEPERMSFDGIAESIEISDVIDDKLYYIVDQKYMYSANLDLTDSKQVLDLSKLRGSNGSIGVYEGIHSGYLYYFADAEKVYSEEGNTSSVSEDKANLYRIPMSDLSRSPEKFIEGMYMSWDFYRFSEGTLYYEPVAFKEATGRDPQGICLQYDISDGKLYSVDLKSGEKKLIVDEPGVVMFLKYAWDDAVSFEGYPSTMKAMNKEITTRNNTMLAFSSGDPYKLWCKGDPGQFSDEGIAALNSQVRAAMAASGYKFE